MDRPTKRGRCERKIHGHLCGQRTSIWTGLMWLCQQCRSETQQEA